MTALTCPETVELLDAFVDAELPGQMLLAVARHAGSCPSCDGALRERSELHEAVERTVRADTEALDLSGVWPVVAARVAQHDIRRVRLRRLRQAPAWAAVAALAAGAVLWLRGPVPEPGRLVASQRTRPNHAVIERLSSEGARVGLRSERKNGTTLIMVSADEAVP